MSSHKHVMLVWLLFLTSFANAQEKGMNWNFQRFTKLTYSYNQKMKINMSLFDDEPPKDYTEVKGKLIVELVDKQTANVILVDTKVTRYLVDSKTGKGEPTISQDAPDMPFFKGLRSNGAVTGGYNQQLEFISKVLFPIISASTDNKTSVEFPLGGPFEIEGVMTTISGKNVINYQSINAGKIKLKSDISCETNEFEANGMHYNCFINGESEFEFNNKEGIFNNGQIDLNVYLLKQNKSREKVLRDMMDIEIVVEHLKTEYNGTNNKP